MSLEGLGLSLWLRVECRGLRVKFRVRVRLRVVEDYLPVYFGALWKFRDIPSVSLGNARERCAFVPYQ